jgi:NADPH-dependent curcumin reductase CurA
MRALISSADGPRLADAAQPTPGPGQVLVRVHAAPLNRADLAMLNGASHGSTGEMGSPLGLEWAGEIAALGEGDSGWKLGDRVSGLGDSAFADYTLIYAALILPALAALSYAEAATMPVALLTSYDRLATNCELQPGQSVLIEDASSGVGPMMLQVAKSLAAALDSGGAGWVDQVLAATEGKGIDPVNQHARWAAVQCHNARDPDRRADRQCRADGGGEHTGPFRSPFVAVHQLHRRHLPHPPGQRGRRTGPRRAPILTPRKQLTAVSASSS